MIQNDEHKDLAVFTIVQEEPEFIHPWINHYKKHVADSNDVYVLVHAATSPEESTSASTGITSEWSAARALLMEHHGVTVVPVHHTSAFDHHWLATTVSKFQSFLLQSYRWVLFAECDEFILPTPRTRQKGDTLLSFIAGLDRLTEPAIRTSGFEVVQQDEELPLPAELYKDGTNVALTAGRMMEGRKYWYCSTQYSKTLLASIPIQWDIGFHGAQGAAHAIAVAPPSPLLTLVHLHKVDFNLALSRARRSRARVWSKVDIEMRRGWQNRIEEASEFRGFWQQDHDTRQPLLPGRLTKIMPGIEEALR